MNYKEDCYFAVDNDSDIIKAICVECHEKNEIGWFWNGKELGYGNYDLNCHFCNKIINKKEE